MQDQVDHMQKLNIRAETINSKMTQAERFRVTYDIKSVTTSTKLLYITPEQAATTYFKVSVLFFFFFFLNLYFIAPVHVFHLFLGCDRGLTLLQ